MAQVKKSRFEETRARCLSANILYEDPEFPAVPKSVYFSKKTSYIQWRRPVELVREPKFFDKGASRLDLHQGNIGNCWFVAAAAILACRPQLFRVVVPDGQEFDERYAGVFHFNFWCFGEWKEVMVDDRLPTVKQDGVRTLVFCSNRARRDEFWAALLEKAYAKLYGSYEALAGGLTEDALVDFTGGIAYNVDLRKMRRSDPHELFDRLMKHDKLSTLMGCGINATQYTLEQVLTNGLVMGHAYSITRVMQITVRGKICRLLRLRNPWGKKEWNGAWSDRSPEWLNVAAAARQELGIVSEEDGEFWMSFDDWLSNFEMLQMCHLSPQQSLPGHADWNVLSFRGSWIRGVNSGGDYWSNSQYCVRLQPPDRSVLSRPSDDHNDGDDKCVVVVSLMRNTDRHNRLRMRGRRTEVPMTFDLYKVKSKHVPAYLSSSTFDKSALQVAHRGGQYQYYREIADQFLLDVGVYVIIPSTSKLTAQTDYLLRVFTESLADGSEMDSVTEPVAMPVMRSEDGLQDLFDEFAFDDRVVDYRELQLILNHAFSQELGRSHSFDLETCRSLVSMLDDDRSGVLEMNELQRLWDELMTWKGVFHQFDKDDSGCIEVSELKNVFRSVGYKLSRLVLKAIARRYGGKEGKLSFNEFALAITKVVSLVDKFPHWSQNGLKGKAELSLDEFLEVIMYF